MSGDDDSTIRTDSQGLSGALFKVSELGEWSKAVTRGSVGIRIFPGFPRRGFRNQPERNRLGNLGS